MSLIKVNSLIHSTGTSNNITLEQNGNTVFRNITVNGDIQMLSTQLLTPAQTGTMEYDGTSLYYTPIGTQRGFIPGMQFYSHPLVGRAGENSTANQSILGVGFSVTAGTLYQFQGRFNFFKTAGTTAHTMSFSWGGTATFRNNRVLTNMLVQPSTVGYTPFSTSRVIYNVTQEAFTSTVITGSISSAFYTINLLVDGMFIANTSGTVIPQYALSAAPGGAYTHSAGNYLSVWPVSAPILTADIAANVSIGTWA